MAKELLSGKELEQDYGLTVPWQRKRRRLKLSPKFIRVGKLVKYRRSDIEEFLRTHAVEPLPARRPTERRASA